MTTAITPADPIPASVIPASVVIVSRDRPEALLRALAGVAQSDHPMFEVIVVADPEGARAVQVAGVPARVAVFDEPNISAARNAGLRLAAAPVVAFLDDDAVPEPTWLSRLVAPFADVRVTASGGYVLGRSGLAWQWQAARVDAQGLDHPFDPGPGVSLHGGDARMAVKTQGTNCAFRRAALLAAGGFDPALRFYLDEADVNLRLAARGGLAAVVPDAVVHHGYAASVRRRGDRVPRSLHDIGASLAVFLRRHAGDMAALDRQRRTERARALAHMVAGRIEPHEVGRLMAGFEAGVAEGLVRPLPPLLPLTGAGAGDFARFPGTGPRPGAVIAGLFRARRRLEAQAASARAAGAVVTLLILWPGLWRHRHLFRADGIWDQRGGLWGRSDRGARAPLGGLSTRAGHEAARLARFRPVDAPRGPG